MNKLLLEISIKFGTLLLENAVSPPKMYGQDLPQAPENEGFGDFCEGSVYTILLDYQSWVVGRYIIIAPFLTYIFQKR